VIPVSVGLLVSVAIAIIGGFWAVALLLLRQIERRIGERFESQDRALELLLAPVKARQQDEAVRLASLADQVRLLATQLPMEYVRREDWIRFSAAIDHKLDKLAELVMRGQRARD
jgi:hypothetical protein